MKLCCRTRVLDLSSPVVMGVINLTPDSFSDGGRHTSADRCSERIDALVEEGAAIIDLGAESTRPGARAIGSHEQLARLMPALERALATSLIVSVDTSDPLVIDEALRAGAHLVNDVRALRRPGAIEAVARHGAAACLMHMRGEPDTMQHDPRYADVVGEVAAYLAERAQACVDAGIGRDSLVIDPGFGFGKTLEHNLALLEALPRLGELGLPVLAGLSRKAIVGAITGRPPGERLAGSVALAIVAVLRGACIVRAHDVAATVDALRVVAATGVGGRT